MPCEAMNRKRRKVTTETAAKMVMDGKKVWRRTESGCLRLLTPADFTTEADVTNLIAMTETQKDGMSDICILAALYEEAVLQPELYTALALQGLDVEELKNTADLHAAQHAAGITHNH